MRMRFPDFYKTHNSYRKRGEYTTYSEECLNYIRVRYRLGYSCHQGIIHQQTAEESKKFRELLSGLSLEGINLLDKDVAKAWQREKTQRCYLALDELEVGDTVYFLHKGGKMRGTVEKKNDVSAKVLTTNGTCWTVDAHLLVKEQGEKDDSK